MENGLSGRRHENKCVVYHTVNHWIYRDSRK